MAQLNQATWRTALVTGASVGIGQEIASILASNGTNLVLVARNKGMLEEQAKSYRARYGVEVEVLAADLSDPAQLLTVEDRARSLNAPIDLLVNNAGFGTNGKFNEMPVVKEEQQVSLNIIALMRLTHAALVQMVSRRQGKILNISSISALVPEPGMATYAGTKAFVTSFSESVYEQLRGTGVSVTAVHPGFTKTEFLERANMEDTAKNVPSFMWMTAQEVASKALSAAAKDKVFYAPGVYTVVAAVLNVMPRWLKRFVVLRAR